MRRTALAGVVLSVLCSSVAGAQTPSVHWQTQNAEILRHYRSLIQIDSSNPPGNETKVVDYLKQVLEAEGIPTRTFALDPARANLVARLKGNGRKRPLLILAHTDVVGVQREKWPVDPFGAVMKDGYGVGTRFGGRQARPGGEPMVSCLLKRSGARSTAMSSSWRNRVKN